MQALHHHDDGGAHHVVEAVAHAFAEEPNRVRAHPGTVLLHHVVRIIKQHPVAALPGADAADRGGELPARLIVLDLLFTDLHHVEAVAPQVAVTRGSDQTHHLAVVAMGEMGAVAEGHVAEVCKTHGAPLPRRPENIHQQTFHEAWGYIDEQAIDLPERDSFEVEANCFERPALDQLGGGLEHRPEVADEVDEPAATRLGPAQLLKVLGHCPGRAANFSRSNLKFFLDSGILFRFKDS
jgi:hypothetical protein